MKRMILCCLLALFSFGGKLWAIDYEEARQRAWFLTDKMAYELNLTADQYDRAYQVNLDYFLSINNQVDCTGYYWTCRDRDLRYILFDWQYTLYSSIDYFFRPIRLLNRLWYYPVYDRYRRGYYFFDRPSVFVSYHGGMWARRGHNAPSPYIGYTPQRGRGLRDRYQANRGGSNFRPEMGRPRNNTGTMRPGNGNMGNGRPQESPNRNGTPVGIINSGHPNNGNASGNTRPGNGNAMNSNAGNHNGGTIPGGNSRPSGSNASGGTTNSRNNASSNRNSRANTQNGSSGQNGSSRTFRSR
jgi:hypothetical protein